VHLYVTGNFASPRHVDFIGQTGLFEAIWFDLEHFDIPVRELAVLNMVARAHNITTIARFKAADYQSVMRVLETGVGGIMCSMVGDAAEAADVVRWAKFHNPRPAEGEVTGARGWNGGNVDACYGSLPAAEYVLHQNTQTMVICQIETPGAVEQVKEIAAVPGVDGLFFGPGDYALISGVVGQLSHPTVIAAAQRVADAAAQSGKWWGTVAPSPETYQRARGMGALLISPGGDNRLMHLGLRALAETFLNQDGRSSLAPGEITGE
jgi:2-keto-3-deoxy-L-rhamnonate aldolase RhmA